MLWSLLCGRRLFLDFALYIFSAKKKPIDSIGKKMRIIS